MILMKDIIREGHDTLTKSAAAVELPMSDDDKKTLNEMLEYIKNSIDEEIAAKYGLRASVGLAAPQINVLKQMTAIHTSDETGEKEYSYMLVNPKIISHSEEMTYLQTGEGCLSIDRQVPGFVMRHKRITVDTHVLTDDGKLEKKRLRFKGYVAIVVQHEIDHLNGIMFTDRIDEANPFLVPDGVKPIEFN